MTSAQQIKREIFLNGPVTAGMQTYNDLLFYKEGIYKPGTGSKKSFMHAVTIVGWGLHENKEYFIIQNTFGPEWGDKGYFKMYTTECGISERAIVGYA
jgi:C1A family cysteine protease